MIVWPIKKSGAIYAGAKLLRVMTDEAGGELMLRVIYGGREEQDIVYEGMFYSQFDESSAGLTITLVSEVTLAQLKQAKHKQAAARFFEDCSANDFFLADMQRRGNRLYVHHTDKGDDYIVLAKRLIFGKTYPRGEGNEIRVNGR